jgi:iron complex transport system permease protein
VSKDGPGIATRILVVSILLTLLLLAVCLAGISTGSSGVGFKAAWWSLIHDARSDPMGAAIIWNIRLPRVILATLVGATLSLGGLVFQALLRNPLAEPYILGVSGGSAIGAIIGILMGFARFPGVSMTAFAGSMVTLLLLLLMSSGHSKFKDSLLLSGVMVNAFSGAIIMFLMSMTQDSRLHNIMFWLMGDLSLADMAQIGILALVLLPCFGLIFRFSHSMNLLLMGPEVAETMGVNIRLVTVALLVTTSLMVSITVSYCGPVGFVGLVMPHLLRLVIGPDHRILVPACIIGGGSYMVFCDILSRVLPQQGEMPAGVVTALIGAPLFIYLLKRSG